MLKELLRCTYYKKIVQTFKKPTIYFLLFYTMRNLGITLLTVACICVLSSCSISPLQGSNTQKIGIEEQTEENKKTLAAVGALMMIPWEEPIIATINQVDVLIKEQPFYFGAENGDKLLIFPKIQKAIIYSPKKNIIINAGPFAINTEKSPAK
jgi:hypothetical protein